MAKQIQSVSHEMKMRPVQVAAIEQINSRMVRITLQGEELHDFSSPSPDDHVKIFFPVPGEAEPRKNFEGQLDTQYARDYTPLHFDAAARSLQIDFALHGAGLGSNWAEKAKVGDKLCVGGPRASRIVPYEFDGYVLIGDECSIPSVRRRLAELPAGAKAKVLLEVESKSDKQAFTTKAQVHVQWVFRNGRKPTEPAVMLAEVRAMDFPAGDCFAWVSMEKSTAMAVKQELIDEHGQPEEWIKATGYWKAAGMEA